MSLPDEAARIARRFMENPKGESIRVLVGVVGLLLSLPLLHLFLQGIFSLTFL